MQRCRWVLATVSKTAPHRVRSGRVSCSVWTRSLIGVLLGAVARVGVPLGGPPGLLLGACERRPGSSADARGRVRARRHCIGAPLCAALDDGHPLACNLGRLRSEEVVLLGAARLADRRAARCRSSEDVAGDDGLAGHDVVMLQQDTPSVDGLVAVRIMTGSVRLRRLGLLVREDCRSCLARGRLGA